MSSTLLLRTALAIVLFAHGIPGLFDGSINDFGNLYLNEVGFAPFGLYIAWAIKLSHIICAVLLLINTFIKPVGIVTIFILIAGIIMIHGPEGWYVVGAGRNGAEYNFVLIVMLLTVMFPNGPSAWVEKLSKRNKTA